MLAMTLMIQGGGSFPETELMDMIFFQSLDVSKPLLYIPLASTWSYTYEDGKKYIYNIAKTCGLNIKIEICHNFKEYLNKLSDFSGVYIWWGNTYKLMLELADWKDSFQEYLRKWWKICWWSAWWIVFWKYINLAPDANLVWWKEFYWYNFLNWYSVLCHYNANQIYNARLFCTYMWWDVMCLPETAWLLVEENEIKVIWNQKILLISHEKKIEKEYLPNEFII